MSLTIGVQLTTRCNLTCTHCAVDGPGDDLAMEYMGRLADYARACNAEFMALTGGEPTLHPQFPEILGFLAENGLKFTMVTNGWNFAERLPQLAPHLANAKQISFSLDGADEATHDANRGAGSFRRVMQAVSVCRSKAVPFAFRMAITQRNIGQIETAALLASKVGAEELVLMHLLPTPPTAAAGLLLSPEDIRHMGAETERLAAIFKMRVIPAAGCREDDPFAQCLALALRTLYFNSRGELSFCCHLTDYRGAASHTDVLCSLAEVSVAEAHRRQIAAVSSFLQAKVGRLERGELSPLDDFPCWYCLKHFGKVDWLAAFSDTAWGREILQASERAGAPPQP